MKIAIAGFVLVVLLGVVGTTALTQRSSVALVVQIAGDIGPDGNG